MRGLNLINKLLIVSIAFSLLAYWLENRPVSKQKPVAVLRAVPVTNSMVQGIGPGSNGELSITDPSEMVTLCKSGDCMHPATMKRKPRMTRVCGEMWDTSINRAEYRCVQVAAGRQE